MVNLAKAFVFQSESAYSKGVTSKTALPFFVSIPHAGEHVPDELAGLRQLPLATLMRDVDRYVDRLYQPAITSLQIPNVQTDIHRYVIDLNRREDEFDGAAVVGANHPVGTHPKGLHWSVTTWGEVLIQEPMSMQAHLDLVKKYYEPFHANVLSQGQELLNSSAQILHLDLHSMPSQGTALHSDPGQTRAQVVLSDFHGKSCHPQLRDLVLTELQTAGFEVAYNWPYVGGGITQRYGKPDQGWSTLQIELNRALYMNEETKAWNNEDAMKLQSQLSNFLQNVMQKLPEVIGGI